MLLASWKGRVECHPHVARHSGAAIADHDVHHGALLHVGLNVCPYIGLRCISGKLTLQLCLLACGSDLLTLNLSLIMGSLRLFRRGACRPNSKRALRGSW